MKKMEGRGKYKSNDQVFSDNEILVEALTVFLGYLQYKQQSSEEIEANTGLIGVTAEIASLYIRTKQLKEHYQTQPDYSPI